MTATLFTGGPIRTSFDSQADLPEAVLVADGRVTAIGSAADCRQTVTSAPRTVDLDGRTLAPGFVDAHAHLLLHGSSLDWADLTSCKTIDDVVSALRTHSSTTAGGPIRGYGYDQNVLAEQRHPVAADLDRIDHQRPVQIQHASGHGYVVNSALLRASGITAETPTPTGGRIDRDDNGEPTGVVFDAACDLLTGPDGVKIGNHGPNFHLPMAEAEIARLIALGQRSFLAAGITSVCDAQVTELELRGYLRARDEGDLALRMHLLMLSSNLDHLVGLGLSSRLGDERLEISGVKFYADGSVVARTAFLGTHTCGDGYLFHDPAELTELIQTAHRLGLTAATHAQGTVPIGIVLDAVAEARERWPRPGLVHRIEHCGFPTHDQVLRMRELAVVPVAQPTQLHLYGDALLRDLGEQGGIFYPYGTFAQSGVPVVISSDAPVTQPGPLLAAWAAITRQTVSGATAGPAELRISRKAALDGITKTPADLLGRADVGELRVGARADLVLLDGDPVTAGDDDLPRIRPTETWVGGTVAWSTGTTG